MLVLSDKKSKYFGLQGYKVLENKQIFIFEQQKISDFLLFDLNL